MKRAILVLTLIVFLVFLVGFTLLVQQAENQHYGFTICFFDDHHRPGVFWCYSFRGFRLVAYSTP